MTAVAWEAEAEEEAAACVAARRAAPRCRAPSLARARGVGRAIGARSCTRRIRCVICVDEPNNDRSHPPI
jgi:hypothetical protein